MKKNYIKILNNGIYIPAILWGEPSSKLLIEVHGNFSNKEDTVISTMAIKAVQKGYQVLSFDLPKHGERLEEDYDLNPQNCVSDLRAIHNYAKTQAPHISLFACSLGAYFSLLAYHNLEIKQSLFLSPVVNMERLIQNMMNSFQISEDQLKAEKQIKLPIGETLDWDYYTYVKENPINFGWNTPTEILYGSKDNISEWREVDSFATRYKAKVKVLDEGEHFFHTKSQLSVFETWIDESLIHATDI